MDYKKEIEELVDLLLKEGASDLHLGSGRTPTIRVSGGLIPLVKKPVLTDADMKGFVKAFLSQQNLDLLESAKDVDFSYNLPHARFRGNVYYRQNVLSVALRLIPKAIRTLSELNLPPILESFTRKPQGFFPDAPFINASIALSVFPFLALPLIMRTQLALYGL
jgi:twitching motility protein PilT